MHLHLQTYFNYCVRLKGKDTLHSVLCANDGQCARGDTHGEEGRLAYCTFPLLSLLLHLYQYVYTDINTRVVGTRQLHSSSFVLLHKSQGTHGEEQYLIYQ